MMKIGAMINCNTEDRHGFCNAILVDNLKKENFDILCFHDASHDRELMFNKSSFLADKLGMTCSFTVTDGQSDSEQKKQVYSISGLTIMAGASTWMLSSGSFPMSAAGKKSSSAQFAIIRKDGNAVLVINILFEKGSGVLRRTQLCQLLEHPVLNKPYAAVLLCGNFTIKGNKGRTSGKNQFSYNVRNGFAAGGGCDLEKRRYKGIGDDSGYAVPNIFVLEDGVDKQTIFNYTNSRLLDSSAVDGECVVFGHAGIVFNMDISREKRNSEQQMYRYVSCTNPWQRTPKRALGCCS
jgi:hypothetical protein